MDYVPYLAGWDSPKQMVREECVPLKQEGRDAVWVDNLTASIDFDQASGEEMADLWFRLQGAPMQADFAFVEPSELESIQAQRGDAHRKWPLEQSREKLLDRMHGAWLGRCCGCALGKPIECFMAPHIGLTSRERIRLYLEAAGAYPLSGYIPGSSPAQDKTGRVQHPASQRENIAFMETDDDIRYTVLGQKILLEHGAAFDSKDIMKMWYDELPYRLVCTAETQAYRNHAMRYQLHHGEPGSVDWLWVASHQNPYREWIGAQVRADSWGYAAPGNPELAAVFAWRDGRMTHVKNGLYGEMFVAAMIAAGFALDDPLAVVNAGLAEIPRRSRLHGEMLEVVEICRRHNNSFANFEKVLHEIERLFGHYHPVHTNNNAALVVTALLLGGNDFEKVVTLSVIGGWDTDCNGATAGSIFGAMHGATRIPDNWKTPLHDTLYSRVFDYHPIAISECARRSLQIADAIRGR